MTSTKCMSCIGRTVAPRQLQHQRLLARARTSHVAQASKGEAGPQSLNSVPLYLLASAAPAALPLAAIAEDDMPQVVADETQRVLGLPIGEVAILLAPVILYSVFTIYRTAINPRVKISDFLFGVGALVVFGNIFSILVLKIRFF